MMQSRGVFWADEDLRRAIDVMEPNTQSPTTWSDLGVLACERCGLKTSCPAFFQAHNCKRKPVTAGISYSSVTGLFTCSICSTDLTEIAFQEHLGIHLGHTATYRCFHCPEHFTSKNLILGHLETVHVSLKARFVIVLSSEAKLLTAKAKNNNNNSKAVYKPVNSNVIPKAQEISVLSKYNLEVIYTDKAKPSSGSKKPCESESSNCPTQNTCTPVVSSQSKKTILQGPQLMSFPSHSVTTAATILWSPTAITAGPSRILGPFQCIPPRGHPNLTFSTPGRLPSTDAIPSVNPVNCVTLQPVHRQFMKNAVLQNNPGHKSKSSSSSELNRKRQTVNSLSSQDPPGPQNSTNQSPAVSGVANESLNVELNHGTNSADSCHLNATESVSVSTTEAFQILTTCKIVAGQILDSSPVKQEDDLPVMLQSPLSSVSENECITTHRVEELVPSNRKNFDQSNKQQTKDAINLRVVKGLFLCLDCSLKYISTKYDLFFRHIWQKHSHNGDFSCCPDGYNTKCVLLNDIIKKMYDMSREQMSENIKNYLKLNQPISLPNLEDNASLDCPPENGLNIDSVSPGLQTDECDNLEKLTFDSNAHAASSTFSPTPLIACADSDTSTSNSCPEGSSVEVKSSACGDSSHVLPISSSKYGTGGIAKHSDRNSTDSSLSDDDEKYFYQCGFDNCLFSTHEAWSFRLHNEESHSNDFFPCFYCGYDSTTVDDLLLHMNGHVGNEKKTFSCSLLESRDKIAQFEHQDFKTVITMLKTSMAGLDQSDTCFQFACNICETVFESVTELQSHFQSSLLKVIECNYCRGYFLNSASCQSHITKDHPGRNRYLGIKRKLLCKDRKINRNTHDLLKEENLQTSNSGQISQNESEVCSGSQVDAESANVLTRLTEGWLNFQEKYTVVPSERENGTEEPDIKPFNSEIVSSEVRLECNTQDKEQNAEVTTESSHRKKPADKETEKEATVEENRKKPADKETEKEATVEESIGKMIPEKTTLNSEIMSSETRTESDLQDKERNLEEANYTSTVKKSAEKDSEKRDAEDVGLEKGTLNNEVASSEIRPTNVEDQENSSESTVESSPRELTDENDSSKEISQDHSTEKGKALNLFFEETADQAGNAKKQTQTQIVIEEVSYNSLTDLHNKGHSADKKHDDFEEDSNQHNLITDVDCKNKTQPSEEESTVGINVTETGHGHIAEKSNEMDDAVGIVSETSTSNQKNPLSAKVPLDCSNVKESSEDSLDKDSVKNEEEVCQLSQGFIDKGDHVILSTTQEPEIRHTPATVVAEKQADGKICDADSIGDFAQIMSQKGEKPIRREKEIRSTLHSSSVSQQLRCYICDYRAPDIPTLNSHILEWNHLPPIKCIKLSDVVNGSPDSHGGLFELSQNQQADEKKTLLLPQSKVLNERNPGDKVIPCAEPSAASSDHVMNLNEKKPVEFNSENSAKHILDKKAHLISEPNFKECRETSKTFQSKTDGSEGERNKTCSTISIACKPVFSKERHIFDLSKSQPEPEVDSGKAVSNQIEGQEKSFPEKQTFCLGSTDRGGSSFPKLSDKTKDFVFSEKQMFDSADTEKSSNPKLSDKTEDCEQGFPKKQNLDTASIEESVCPKFRCSVCTSFTSYSYTTMQQHLKCKHLGEPVKIIRINHRDSKDLDLAKKMKQAVLYECIHRGCHFASEWNSSLLRKHIKKNHPYYSCGYCGNHYSVLLHLNNHFRFVHRNLRKEIVESDLPLEKLFRKKKEEKSQPRCHDNSLSIGETKKETNTETKENKPNTLDTSFGSAKKSLPEKKVDGKVSELRKERNITVIEKDTETCKETPLKQPTPELKLVEKSVKRSFENNGRSGIQHSDKNNVQPSKVKESNWKLNTPDISKSSAGNKVHETRMDGGISEVRQKVDNTIEEQEALIQESAGKSTELSNLPKKISLTSFEPSHDSCFAHSDDKMKRRGAISEVPPMKKTVSNSKPGKSAKRTYENMSSIMPSDKNNIQPRKVREDSSNKPNSQDIGQRTAKTIRPETKIDRRVSEDRKRVDNVIEGHAALSQESAGKSTESSDMSKKILASSCVPRQDSSNAYSNDMMRSPKEICEIPPIKKPSPNPTPGKSAKRTHKNMSGIRPSDGSKVHPKKVKKDSSISIQKDSKHKHKISTLEGTKKQMSPSVLATEAQNSQKRQKLNAVDNSEKVKIPHQTDYKIDSLKDATKPKALSSKNLEASKITTQTADKFSKITRKKDAAENENSSDKTIMGMKEYPLQCTVCKVFMKCVRDIEDHFKWLHQGETIQLAERKSQCIFANSGKLVGNAEGMQLLLDPHLCNYCSFRHEDRSSVENHVVKAHPHEKMIIVSLHSLDLPQLADRSTSITSIVPGDELPVLCAETERDVPQFSSLTPAYYNCYICDTSLRSEFLFRLHLAKHRGFKHKTILTPTDGLLVCPTCGYIANSTNDLAQHTGLHMDERRFKCSLCQFDSHTRKGFGPHMKKFHKNEEAEIIDLQKLRESAVMRRTLVQLDPKVNLTDPFTQHPNYLRALLVKYEIRLLDVVADVCSNILEQNDGTYFFVKATDETN